LAPSPAHIRSTIAAVVDQPDELRALRIVHKTLADVNRLRIVQRLSQGEATVSELIERVGLSQPLVSWHLRSLRYAGLIQTRRVGRETRIERRRLCADRLAEHLGLRPRGSDRRARDGNGDERGGTCPPCPSLGLSHSFPP